MKLKNKTRYHQLPILDGLRLLDAKQHTRNFPFHTHDTFNITLVLDQLFCTRLSNRFLQAPVGAIVITNPEEVQFDFLWLIHFISELFFIKVH